MSTDNCPFFSSKFRKEFVIDQDRVDAAREILEGGSAKVYKSTRSGFTTSAVIAATQSGKRMLCLSPTIRILKETIKKGSIGSEVLVAANCFCSKLKNQFKEDKFLKKLPVILPKCEKCSEYGICDVTEILTADDPQIIGITHKKLEALMLSKSDTAKDILEILSKVDIAMLDEAHMIALPHVVRIRAFTEIQIPEEFGTLTKVVEKWYDLNTEFIDDIEKMKRDGDEGHVGKHLSKRISIARPLTFE